MWLNADQLSPYDYGNSAQHGRRRCAKFLRLFTDYRCNIDDLAKLEGHSSTTPRSSGQCATRAARRGAAAAPPHASFSGAAEDPQPCVGAGRRFPPRGGSGFGDPTAKQRARCRRRVGYTARWERSANAVEARPGSASARKHGSLPAPEQPHRCVALEQYRHSRAAWPLAVESAIAVEQ